MPDYKTVPIPIATNGLNKDLQPTQIPSASPNMVNMMVENWGVRKRLGYSTLGTNLPLPGIGMELVQYPDARGNLHHLAFTTTCIFLYDSDSEQWLNICPPTIIEDCEDDWVTGAGADSSSAQSDIKKVGTNALKIEVKADSSDGDILCYEDLATTDITTHNIISFWVRSTGALSAGSIEIVLTEAELGAKTGTITTDYIEITNPIAMSANTWYNFSVALTGSRITTTLNAIESIAVYSNHETELDGVDIYLDDIKVTTGFNGDASNRWSHGVAFDPTNFSNNGGSALVVSNNVDSIYYYEGDAGDTFAALDMSDFANFASAKEIVEFWNHFFAFNYADTSRHVRSLAYTNLGNIKDWTGGTSGSNTLTDTIGKLLRAKKLGADLILYSENSITTCRYYGSTILFLFPTLVYETGLFAEKAIWDFVNVHYFLGTDQKIYGYGGGQQLLPIGEPIEDSLFESLDVSKKERIVVGLDPVKHKLYFFVPSSSDDYPKQSYVYNYKQRPATWEFHEFNDTVRDFSIFSNKSAWYADGSELAGTYADETSFYADSSFTQSGQPVAVILTHDGFIFKLDEALGLDNTTNIPCVYDTMDITLDGEEHYFRTVWVSFNLMSTKATGTFSILYSVDGGDSWISIETNYSISSALANSWSQHRIPIDVTARKLRFRLTQDSDKDLRIRSANIKMIPQTDRE